MDLKRLASMVVFLAAVALFAATGQGLAPSQDGYDFYACAFNGRIVAWLGLPASVLELGKRPAAAKLVVDLVCVRDPGQLKDLGVTGQKVAVRFGLYTVAPGSLKIHEITKDPAEQGKAILLYILQDPAGDAKGYQVGYYSKKQKGYVLMDAAKGGGATEDGKLVYETSTATLGLSAYVLYRFTEWPKGDPYAVVPPWD